MLDRAKQQLIEIVGALRPQIQAETPVVVLEPGCASVFRDEMTELLWGNVDASRLKKQVFSLGEFLEKKAGEYRPPAVPRKVYVHGHCHQKSAGKMKEEQHLIRKMGAEYREIDSGCCGMAGAFGYEAGTHYDVSMACAERALLPAVRAAEQDALIVSDGFSCREQIQQTTGRQALHLAQVVRIGIGERDGVVETRAHGSWGALWVAAAALAIGAALRLGSRHR
jgi:Fe-S oxidoreductase